MLIYNLQKLHEQNILNENEQIIKTFSFFFILLIIVDIFPCTKIILQKFPTHILQNYSGNWLSVYTKTIIKVII
jgi:hypothetical protein